MQEDIKNLTLLGLPKGTPFLAILGFYITLWKWKIASRFSTDRKILLKKKYALQSIKRFFPPWKSIHEILILLRFEIKRVKLCFPRLPSDCLKFHHGRRHFKTNSFSWQSVQQKSIFTNTRLSTVRGDFLCAESISKWWRWWSNFEHVWWQLTCVRLAAFFSIWSHGFFVIVVFVVVFFLCGGDEVNIVSRGHFSFLIFFFPCSLLC